MIKLIYQIILLEEILIQYWDRASKYFNPIKLSRKMISSRCDKCNIDVHRASYAKHLRSEKDLQNELIIPE